MSRQSDARAREIVRDAVLASIALVARDVNEVDVPPAVLIEGADTAIVAQLLAAMVGTLLGATLEDGGRQLLVRISRRVVEDAE